MKYNNIIPGIFLKRPNRFIAEVEIDGQKETVHVKNTGRCRELLIPGCEVWLTEPGTPGRKTKYDLVAVRKSSGVLFNIDSQAPNKVVKQWLETMDYNRVVPEYTYGDSRIDFYMERGKEKFLMEVKGCTLEVDGVGYFPDAPTERGVKHIRELIKAKKAGFNAILAFVIQKTLHRDDNSTDSGSIADLVSLPQLPTISLTADGNIEVEGNWNDIHHNGKVNL